MTVGSSVAFSATPSEPASAVEHAAIPRGREATHAEDLSGIYELYFDRVWRTMIRLGLTSDAAEDAAHDVFLIVHRRAAEFEGRSSLGTWIYGITMRVAQYHRRQARRNGYSDLSEVLVDGSRGPLEEVTLLQARAVLHELLDKLPEEQREVFVLAELEELGAPEIATVIGVPLNTVYSRLRLARQRFELALRQMGAKASWRQP